MFEVGDWVRCVDADESDKLELNKIYVVRSVLHMDTSTYIAVNDTTSFCWLDSHFALVHKRNAPLRVGDRVKVKKDDHHQIGTGRIASISPQWDFPIGVLFIDWLGLRHRKEEDLELVEPVEARDGKENDMEMMSDSNGKPVCVCIGKEPKLRYELVKMFNLHVLEMAGACVPALMKIVKDHSSLIYSAITWEVWSKEAEKYFDQDFSDVNGLKWLCEHGFIRKVSEWPKPIGECKGYEGYLKAINSGQIVAWNKGLERFVYVGYPKDGPFPTVCYEAKVIPVNVKITVEEV